MKNFETIKRAVHEKSKEKIFGNLESEISTEGISAVHKRLDRYFDMLNIKPDYTLENSQEKHDFREKLNNEAGVIISNHPGYIDIPAVMRVINRSDIKIMIREEYVSDLQKMVGSNFFVPASKNTKELLLVLKEVVDHINAGGVFLIFPSGGSDLNNIDFKKGFAYLLEKLSADKMVYSFYVNESDVSRVVGGCPSRHIGLASSVLLSTDNNVNRLLPKEKFRIDEKYTTVDQWRSIGGDGGLEEKSNLFTSYYKQLFNLEPEEKD